jgi:hypothetical protein
MRAILLAVLALPAVIVAGSPAFAQEPAPADKAEPAAADASAAAMDEITLPPGFKKKKRGKFVVYCRKETAMGTRFPVEKCYDEQGIRDYLADQRENQKQVDQMRRICGSMEACGGG